MNAPIYRLYAVNPPFSDALLSACLSIPGIKVGKDKDYVQSPTNAAWLVEGIVRQHGQAYRTWKPRQEVSKAARSLSGVKGLRPVDPKTGIAMEAFVAPYQAREALRFAGSSAFLAVHPPGSGKSLTSMIWALAAGAQKTVVVTGAKGRGQWRDQLQRYTTVPCHVISGTGHRGLVEMVLANLLAEALTGKKIDAVRKPFKAAKLTCSCGADHSYEIVKPRGSQYLVARVQLPIGRHRLSLHDAAETFDIQDPQIPESARFIVLSWSILPYHIEKLEELKPEAVILDESHTAKNHRKSEMVVLSEADIVKEPQAKQLEDGRWVKFVDLENISSATFRLCKAKSVKHRALLTGTPIKDRVRDLWAQLNYAEPYGWGSYWQWAKRYCGASTNTWGGMDDRGATNLDELRNRMSFICSVVSRDESHGSLPPFRREVVYIPPDAQQRADEGFAEELAAAARARAAVHSIANIQLAEACSRKRRAVCDEVVEAANGGSKIVIFTARRYDVDTMTELIPKRLAKGVSFFATHGGDSPESRYSLVKEYMALPDRAVLVATGYSLGEQIDLNETDLAIFAQLPWTPAEIEQWEGRFVRKGSTRACLLKYMIAEGTIDERVASILLEKLPTVEKMGSETAGKLRQDLLGNTDDLMASLAAAVMSNELLGGLAIEQRGEP